MMRVSRAKFMVRRLMAIAAVLYPLLSGCGSLEEFPDTGSVFEATFGTRPGPGVTILQAYGQAFGDNTTAYLRLKASPAAFAALRAIRFMPITAGNFKAKTQGASNSGPTPTWWSPLKDSPTIFL
jgi:hypothetical protein